MDKREKRLMRVHRRSLDQREMRHEEVNKRRQIDDMSPVVELESHEGSKNPSRSTTPGTVLIRGVFFVCFFSFIFFLFFFSLQALFFFYLRLQVFRSRSLPKLASS